MSDQTQGRHDEEQERPGAVEQGQDRPDAVEQDQERPGAVDEARADLAAGREWKARDRLTADLADHYDEEALDLLGEVAYAMRDLPAAGAAWFATARRGEEVDEATEAWRERYQDDFARMWDTLPGSVRDRAGNKRVDALRRRAEEADWPEGASERSGGGPEPADPAAETAQAPPMDAEQPRSGVDAAVVIAVVIAIFLLVCTVVGFVTVLLWLVPG